MARLDNIGPLRGFFGLLFIAVFGGAIMGVIFYFRWLTHTEINEALGLRRTLLYAALTFAALVVVVALGNLVGGF